MLYDAFICHASEDKGNFVRPLAESLSQQHLEIWYDEFSLNVGDSLRQAIDYGLAKSRFGIVVLSRSFFRKGWAQRELDGLVARQIAEERRLILPIWHDITHAEILQVSPPLADIVAINSMHGIQRVCQDLLRKIRPGESPLIAARDELIRRGIEPPVISDEWWLDIVEASNRIPGYGAFVPDQATWGRWTFPLPHTGELGAKRGLHLAWTAMQLKWSEFAADNNICQITHPDTVHSFIRRFPGLDELCDTFPEFVACYVPQLTIPEFSGDLGPSFDDLLQSSLDKRTQERARGSISGTGLTIDGGIPLCDEEIALRHPTFGNYEPAHVACFYVQGELMGPRSRHFETIDYLVWLLSDESNWLPIRCKEFLLEGMRQWTAWVPMLGDYGDRRNPFLDKIIIYKGPKNLKFTKPVREGLEQLIRNSLSRTKINARSELIMDRFMERRFVEGLREAHIRNHKRR